MTLKILIAMVLGAIVGAWFGSVAAAVGAVGAVVIQLIKAAATPLVFLAVARAVATTQVRGGAFARVAAVATFNVSVAICIGLALSNLVRPGSRMTFAETPAGAAIEGRSLDWAATLKAFVPHDIVTPFAENAVFSVVILALLFGFALRVVAGEEGGVAAVARKLQDVVAALYRVMEVILGWVLALIPLAVFAVVAKTVAEHGLAPLGGLALYVAVGLSGLALHVLVTYQLWIALYVRMPLGRFWRAAKEPLAVAFGSNSSLATLPVTLRALDTLGVSRASSAVGACVATNLNNDGIVLYEGMAALLVAQAAGIELSLAQQAVVAVFCVVAAMGVAGIPEAGFISLALVLNAVHLPLELLPLLLTVDWVIARGRSVVNVLSDMVLSMVLEASHSVTSVTAPPGAPAGYSPRRSRS